MRHSIRVIVLLGLVAMNAACRPQQVIVTVEVSQEPLLITATPEPTFQARGLVQGQFDVGGYSLYLSCGGDGSPTILFEHGLGVQTGPGVWGDIPTALIRTNRVCFYDRAGVGASQSFPEQGFRTSQSVAEDLHLLLNAAGEPGPFLLIGHSEGGFHARYFAAMYGEDVVGLVLLDPTVEGWEEYLQTQIPPEAFASILLEDVSHPERWERYDSFEEIRSWYAGDNQPFDDMPITVISRGIPFRDAYLTPEQAVTMLEEWHSYHTMVADQSSRGKLVVAEGAGHFPHFEIPALVISSIYEILELVGEIR